MKILLTLFIFNFFIVASEQNITNNQHILDIKKYKQDINTKVELDKYSIKINSISNRIDDISSSTDKLSIVLASSIALFGILITIIVLILAFKSRSDAKLEAQEAIKNYIEKEAKIFVDEQLKETTQQYLDKLQEESSEKINNIISELDNYTNDIELSIDDKKYLDTQIKSIKIKAIAHRNFNDWQKIILYEIANKNFNKALMIINDLTQKSTEKQERSKLYYLKGIILDKQDKINESKTYFEKVLELTPNYSEAYRKIGSILGTKKEYLQAIEYCEKAVLHNPYDYQAYNNIGFYYRKLNKISEAIKYYKKAIEINPDFRVPYNNIGTIELYKKEYEEALTWYKKAIEVDNQYAFAYHSIFRLNLVTNTEFDKDLVTKFINNFKNDPSNYKIFEMILILKKIKNNKNQTDKIESWIKKYNHFKFRNYLFDPIDIWIDKESNIEIKNNLKNAIKQFKNNSIKY